MPQTITKTVDGQIIGATFSSAENANKAVAALEDELSIPAENIQLLIQPTKEQSHDAHLNMLIGRGFTESQARYFNDAVKNGKILVAVHGVTDPAPVIDILDQYKAEYNPNGARNVRQDVMGMTTGAAVGAVAGSVVGAAFGGPVGAAAGAAAGAVIGGGGGAAAGKAVEHNK